jgi:hypothetical protein
MRFAFVSVFAIVLFATAAAIAGEIKDGTP